MTSLIRQPKPYQVRRLIPGKELGMPLESLWVAVPDNLAPGPILVKFGPTGMLIKDWKKEAWEFKRFRDKYWKRGSNRRQIYTLGYFKFVPEQLVEL